MKRNFLGKAAPAKAKQPAKGAAKPSAKPAAKGAAKPAAKGAAAKKPAAKVAGKAKVPPKPLLSKPKRQVPVKQQKGVGKKVASAPVAKALKFQKKVSF